MRDPRPARRRQHRSKARIDADEPRDRAVEVRFGVDER